MKSITAVTLLTIFILIVPLSACCEPGTDMSRPDESEVTSTTQPEESGISSTEEQSRPEREPIIREYILFPKDVILYDEVEKAQFYCPDIFMPTVVPNRVKIETGEIQYACPVEGCTHKGKDCFYYNKWVKSIYDTGNYLIINALDTSGTNSIFAYEWGTGKLTTICQNADSIDALIPGIYDGMIYGYSVQLGNNTSIVLYGIDLYSGKVSFEQLINRDLSLLFCKDGDIYGVSTTGPVILYTPKSAPKTYKLPDGCENYKIYKPGMLYDPDAPAAIYDITSKKTVNPDPALDITAPVRVDDWYYYQSRSGSVVTGEKSNGAEVQYIRYDNDIYKQTLDGNATKFTASTDYHFVIYAASGDYVIGRLMYKLSNGIYTPFEELDHDHIRINIKTGEIQLLDLYFEHAYFE